MYGIVNQGIRTLVTRVFGEPSWAQVVEKADVGEVYDVSKTYPDEMTFKLAQAVSEVSNLSLQDVLITYGKWWINEYSDMIIASGKNFVEFIDNLNEHHKKLSYMMPELKAPMFDVANHRSGTFELKYRSCRDGLEPFVVGLVEGLGDLFEQDITIKQVESKADGVDYSLFFVTYQEAQV